VSVVGRGAVASTLPENAHVRSVSVDEAESISFGEDAEVSHLSRGLWRCGVLSTTVHCKNIRMSTDILRRVFSILTEPLPYTFVSID